VKKERKENSPLTHDNLSSPYQQHKEKISNTTENNDNLSNDSSRTDSPKKLEIKFTPDYNEKEPVFWRVIGELSNDGLVYYDKLHERLVSTGQLFVGEAVLMIEHMEKIGRIEKTEDYNIYRIKESTHTGIMD
jgi:hypothetical protein